MKFLILASALTFSACTFSGLPNDWSGSLAGSEPPETKYVTVLGRSWAVFPAIGFENVYVAQRDNNGLDPFGAPAYRRTPQAIRAIELASGCKVDRSDIVQQITARYFASVICK